MKARVNKRKTLSYPVLPFAYYYKPRPFPKGLDLPPPDLRKLELYRPSYDYQRPARQPTGDVLPDEEDYKFNKNMFCQINSQKWGKILICKHDWVQKKAIKQSFFAFTPKEISELKKIKKIHGDESYLALMIAKKIFNGVLDSK